MKKVFKKETILNTASKKLAVLGFTFFQQKDVSGIPLYSVKDKFGNVVDGNLLLDKLVEFADNF